MKLFAQPLKTLLPKVDAKQVTIIKTGMLKVSKTIIFYELLNSLLHGENIPVKREFISCGTNERSTSWSTSLFVPF